MVLVTAYSASAYVESHGVPLIYNTFTIVPLGFQIATGVEDLNLTVITKTTGTDADTAKVYDSSFVLQDSAVFSGNDATFSGVLLLANSTYYVMVEHTSGSYNADYDPTAAGYYPIIGTYLNWVSGEYYQGNADGTTAYAIENLTVVVCAGCRPPANHLYEDYDSVNTSDFTGGTVTPSCAFNTTNGFQSKLNSYSQPFSYSLYSLTDDMSANYTYTQMNNAIDPILDGQTYGMQGIGFYQGTTAKSVIHFEVNPSMSMTFPKTEFIVFSGNTDGYALTLLDLTGCTPINANTWWSGRIDIQRTSDPTNFTLTATAFDSLGNLLCTGKTNFIDTNIQDADNIRIANKDGHGSGSGGYCFDEVELKLNQEAYSPPPVVDSCVNGYTYNKTDGSNYNVSAGHVCINSTNYDVPQTTEVFCNQSGVGYLLICNENATSANAQYMGYVGDGTSSCDFGSFTTLNTWNATPGTHINETIQLWTGVCPTELPPIIENSSVSNPAPTVTPGTSTVVELNLTMSSSQAVQLNISNGAYSFIVDCGTGLVLDCPIALPYYAPPGDYNVDVIGETQTQELTSVFNYAAGQYTARVGDSVTFSGATYGVQNKTPDAPLVYYNQGNVPVTAAYLTAHDLTSSMGYTLSVSNFRAGLTIENSVPLQNNVPVSIPFALVTGNNSQVNFYIWSNIPSNQYPTQYVSNQIWGLTLE